MSLPPLHFRYALCVKLLTLCFTSHTLSASHLQHQSPALLETIGLFDRDFSHAVESTNTGINSSYSEENEDLQILTDKYLATTGSAGLGIELETSGFLISPVGECSYRDFRAAKGKIINGVRGQKWKLTADIIGDQLDLEYIIDGTAVKIGSMEAHAIAGQIERHHISWHPEIGDEVTVEDSRCRWELEYREREMSEMVFTPQITAALPLSVIYRILRAAEFGDPNSHFLDHFERPGQERVIVTKEFFRSHPLGIDPETVNEDVLGFFSIVLSWAKGTMNSRNGMLFKGLSWVMPRTDFVGLYDLVDHSLPEVELYRLIKVLACYRNDYSGPQSTRHNVVLDHRYCTGSLDTPIPFDIMDTQEFKVFRNGSVVDTLLVSDWIDDIQNKRSPDGLSILGEKHFSASIGGKGLELFAMYGGSKRVPLWEFRDLNEKRPRDFQRFVVEAEQGLIELVQRYLAI